MPDTCIFDEVKAMVRKAGGLEEGDNFHFEVTVAKINATVRYNTRENTAVSVSVQIKVETFAHISARLQCAFTCFELCAALRSNHVKCF